MRARSLLFPIAWLLIAVAAQAAPDEAPGEVPETSRDEASATASAIALGHDGKAAFERGQYDEAARAFAAAEALTHSPVFVLFLARSQRAGGQLLAAKASYQRLAEDAQAGHTLPDWLQAIDDGAREAAALETTIPTLQLTLRGGAGELRIDGVVATSAAVQLDPGKHHATATRAGKLVAEKHLTLREGEHLTVMLEPAPAPVPQPPQQPVPTATTTAPAPLLAAPVSPGADAEPTLNVVGALLLGLGGAGHATSIVAGALALDRAAEAKAACGPTGECAAGDSDAKAGSLTLSHVSTTGLVVGSVLALAGSAMLLWPTDDDNAERPAVALGVTGARLIWPF